MTEENHKVEVEPQLNTPRGTARLEQTALINKTDRKLEHLRQLLNKMILERRQQKAAAVSASSKAKKEEGEKTGEKQEEKIQEAFGRFRNEILSAHRLVEEQVLSRGDANKTNISNSSSGSKTNTSASITSLHHVVVPCSNNTASAVFNSRQSQPATIQTTSQSASYPSLNRGNHHSQKTTPTAATNNVAPAAPPPPPIENKIKRYRRFVLSGYMFILILCAIQVVMMANFNSSKEDGGGVGWERRHRKRTPHQEELHDIIMEAITADTTRPTTKREESIMRTRTKTAMEEELKTAIKNPKKKESRKEVVLLPLSKPVPVYNFDVDDLPPITTEASLILRKRLSQPGYEPATFVLQEEEGYWNHLQCNASNSLSSYPYKQLLQLHHLEANLHISTSSSFFISFTHTIFSETVFPLIKWITATGFNISMVIVKYVDAVLTHFLCSILEELLPSHLFRELQRECQPYLNQMMTRSSFDGDYQHHLDQSAKQGNGKTFRPRHHDHGNGKEEEEVINGEIFELVNRRTGFRQKLKKVYVWRGNTMMRDESSTPETDGVESGEKETQKVETGEWHYLPYEQDFILPLSTTTMDSSFPAKSVRSNDDPDKKSIHLRRSETRDSEHTPKKSYHQKQKEKEGGAKKKNVDEKMPSWYQGGDRVDPFDIAFYSKCDLVVSSSSTTSSTSSAETTNKNEGGKKLGHRQSRLSPY